MSLLIGTFTIGCILSLLALGVFISFRIFAFPDITADGSVTLGAAVAATLMVHGTSPLLASLAAFGAGMLAGASTGTLYTRFKINSLLSGILVMTALYSINLRIMGQSRVRVGTRRPLVPKLRDGMGRKARERDQCQQSLDDQSRSEDESVAFEMRTGDSAID